MLVVVGIITVVVLLAIPILNVLQGNRSVDTAQNQLQALLNESRMMAIGLQRDSGVFFYIDPSSKRIQTVLVQAAPPQALPGNTAWPDRQPHLCLPTRLHHAIGPPSERHGQAPLH